MFGSRYEATEETLRKELTAAELDTLLAARGTVVRGRDAVRHLLYRARVTISTLEEEKRHLRKAVDKLREPKQRLGAPTTLSPLDAVKFASPEEMAAIVGHINSAQLTSLQRNVLEARARREALSADLLSVRTATQAMLNRADLPTSVRLDFTRLLNSLPEDPAPVVDPAALEMAHVVGMLPRDEDAMRRPEATRATSTGATTAGAATTGAEPADANEASTAQAPVVRELPDADPAADLRVPAAAPADHVRTNDMPCYGPAPLWVPGAGPAPGS